jgi:hypothetical protein
MARIRSPLTSQMWINNRLADSLSASARDEGRRGSKTRAVRPPPAGVVLVQKLASCRSNRGESGTTVPPILPSLCRQPPRIEANNGALSRMRIRRWQACTNNSEPSRTGLQPPCKRAVVSSILTGGSHTREAFAQVDAFLTSNRRAVRPVLDAFWTHIVRAYPPQDRDRHRTILRTRPASWPRTCGPSSVGLPSRWPPPIPPVRRPSA